MRKQKRKKRRHSSSFRLSSLLFLSVFFLLLSGLFYFGKKDLLSHIPTNTANKEAIAIGIDVSEWQTTIDFKKVKQQGYSFVFIRTGFGWEYEDAKFKEHIKQAKNANLDVGVYHYSHATTIEEAKREANLVLDIIEDYDLDLPIFYDIETDRQNHLSTQQLTNLTLTFLETIENAGYKAGIYAARSWFENRLDTTQLDTYPIWIANYTEPLTYEGRFDYWQYTNKGQVDGVVGDCDINIHYKSVQE